MIDIDSFTAYLSAEAAAEGRSYCAPCVRLGRHRTGLDLAMQCCVQDRIALLRTAEDLQRVRTRHHPALDTTVDVGMDLWAVRLVLQTRWLANYCLMVRAGCWRDLAAS